MSILVGTTLVNQSDTIYLNVSSTYIVTCLAVQAKPDVNLILYDSDSLITLGSSSNSKTTHQCDSNNLCNVIYQVNFLPILNTPLASMTSLTCMASSVLPQIDLNSFIARNVVILNQNKTIGNLKYNYINYI